MPSHPPERDLREGYEFDLQNIRWADELGYEEGWVGEHHTAPWEPLASPDFLVMEGFRQTENIRLGPGGFLLPYHHPAELANRIATMDQPERWSVEFRCCGERPSVRLGDVQRRWHVGPEPGHNPRGARNHPAHVGG